MWNNEKRREQAEKLMNHFPITKLHGLAGSRRSEGKFNWSWNEVRETFTITIIEMNRLIGALSNNHRF